MKLAIMLAGVTSGNKIARDPTQLLAQGARLVQSSPQLSALSDEVRGRLIEAGKGIAVAVVSKQMDSLSDRISERNQRISERLDERTGALRTTGSDRAADEADPADDDWADEDQDDHWADDNPADQDRADADPDRAGEDRAEQDRGVRQTAQPRPRRAAATTASASSARRGGGAAPSRKRTSTSSATNGSDDSADNAVRNRTAGGSQRGERDA